MTRYVIAGAGGMLGRDLQSALAGRDVVALDRGALDVTDLESVRAAVRGVAVVINAAAYTQVDAAETDEDAAFAVNAIGPQNLAIATAETGAQLVTISTDYVFDGHATAPYDEQTPRDPINAYGRTKAAGEQLALEANPRGTYVVRTAWLYGGHGQNFAATMLRLAAERDTVAVVDDQLGQPTWSLDLAHQIRLLLDSGAAPGLYHGTNAGETTWFGFARAIFELSGLDPERVRPVSSSSFERPAPRPAYSVLGHEAWRRAGLAPMRDWRSALQQALSSGALQA